MVKNNMEVIESLDKLQRLDHDTLTRLSANFENFLYRYSSDIQELKDGTNRRLTGLDARLQVVEKVHDKIDPEKFFIRFETMEGDYRDFKRMWKGAQTLVIMIAGFIGFILATIASLLNIFKH